MKLSNDFTLEELIESSIGRRFGIVEQFNPDVIIVKNLRNLCVNVLQVIRDKLNLSIIISSGYRCKLVNSKANGSKNSDHLYGYAADIKLIVNGENKNQLLFDTILKEIPEFTQLIDEYGTEDEPAWIHVSYNPNNLKNEILRTRINSDGKLTYMSIK